MLNSTWQFYLNLISFSSNAVTLRVMRRASADSTWGRIGIGNGIKAEREEKNRYCSIYQYSTNSLLRHNSGIK